MVEGGNCGELKGKKYFDCKKGYGLFQPLHVLKRDDRFTASTEGIFEFVMHVCVFMWKERG